MTTKPKRIIVGMSGASGSAVYGIRLLEVLRDVPHVETHLVVSSAAAQQSAKLILRRHRLRQ